VRQLALSQIAEQAEASADNENCPEQVYSVWEERQPREERARDEKMDGGLQREKRWSTAVLEAKNGIFRAKTAVFEPKMGKFRGLMLPFR